MAADGRPQAILLPGAVLPAEIAYRRLLEALGAEVETVAKELEVYAGEEPPPGYTLTGTAAFAAFLIGGERARC